MTEQIKDAVRSALADVPIPATLFPRRFPTWRDKLRAWYIRHGVYWYSRWWYWRESRRKIVWRCVAYHGAGRLITPKPMTEKRAIAWLRRAVDGAVTYVDRETGHIFYKPRV